MDSRFDRIYLLKAEPDSLDRIKQLCIDYNIDDNGVFENAASFHFAWGFGPDGIIYISPTTFLNHRPDFNSIEELENYLDRFVSHKNLA